MNENCVCCFYKCLKLCIWLILHLISFTCVKIFLTIHAQSMCLTSALFLNFSNCLQQIPPIVCLAVSSPEHLLAHGITDNDTSRTRECFLVHYVQRVLKTCWQKFQYTHHTYNNIPDNYNFRPIVLLTMYPGLHTWKKIQETDCCFLLCFIVIIISYIGRKENT